MAQWCSGPVSTLASLYRTLVMLRGEEYQRLGSEPFGRCRIFLYYYCSERNIYLTVEELKMLCFIFRGHGTHVPGREHIEKGQL
jgi:hypothetical protein